MIFSHSAMLLPFQLLVLSVGLTGADKLSGVRLSMLYTQDGQSPCALEDKVKNACFQSERRDSASPEAASTWLDQPTSSCTCNIIFFNLWSACLFSNGNSTLPTFDQWSETCGRGSWDVNDYSAMDGVNVTSLPSWARLQKPDPTNTTFDVGSAIIVALNSKGPTWSTSQKIAPVASASITLLIVSCCYLYYRKNGVDFSRWRINPRKLFRRPRKVKTGNRNEAWTIDRAESTNENHQMRPRDSYGVVMTGSPTDYEDHYAAQLYERHAQVAETAGNGTTSRLWDWQGSLSLPLFRRPYRAPVVRHVMPPRGWRLASWDRTTDSSSNLHSRPSMGASTAHGAAFSANHDPIEEEVEDPVASDVGHEGEIEIRNQETQQLISEEERSEADVFLISHIPGEDFTLESGDSRDSHRVHLSFRSASSHGGGPASGASSSIHSPVARKIIAPPQPPSFYPSYPEVQDMPKSSSRKSDSSFSSTQKPRTPNPSKLSQNHSIGQQSSQIDLELHQSTSQVNPLAHNLTGSVDRRLPPPPRFLNEPEENWQIYRSPALPIVPEIRVPSSSAPDLPYLPATPDLGSTNGSAISYHRQQSSSPLYDHRRVSPGGDAMSSLSRQQPSSSSTRHQRCNVSTEDVAFAPSQHPRMLLPGSAGHNASPRLSLDTTFSSYDHHQRTSSAHGSARTDLPRDYQP
ncbi:hypothetical protein AX17_004260 [Amanita inopinata Kibby_2008]|nr:hypothetical protein AX17_004260 [Amanita inopinata Kibby_2008]